MECREPAGLPAVHPKKEAHYIGLLLPPQLLDGLVCYLMAPARRKGRAFLPASWFFKSSQKVVSSKRCLSNSVHGSLGSWRFSLSLWIYFLEKEMYKIYSSGLGKLDIE